MTKLLQYKQAFKIMEGIMRNIHFELLDGFPLSISEVWVLYVELRVLHFLSYAVPQSCIPSPRNTQLPKCEFSGHLLGATEKN